MSLNPFAQALGGEVIGGAILCPGPGHSSRDRSLSVWIDPAAPDGFRIHSHAGDDFKDCRDHVRSLLGIGGFESSRRREAPVIRAKHDIGSQPPEPTTSNVQFAARIWQEARPIGGTLAERYLCSRAIEPDPRIFVGDALRFHPSCPFRLESGEHVRLPAMVAAMVAIHGSIFQGIHRTALAADGCGKARVRGLESVKQMLGRAGGAVLKLCPDEDVSLGLALSEGIETGLSCQGLGYRSLWACLTEGAIRRFPVLPGIECLTVFADNDPERRLPSGRIVRPGLDAARICAARWVDAGVECIVISPPTPGADFNDLAERAA